MIRRFRKTARSSLTERLSKLGVWLQTDAGQGLLHNQELLLEHELNTIFGYHACQFSVFPGADLLASSAVRRQYMLTPVPLKHCPQSQLIANPYHWPMAPESLDLVFLHHTLDIADSPHRLLSEAANTVIPNGKIIIAGFNPFSIGNLSRWLIPSQRRLLRDARFIAPMRLRDWLKLLNFHVDRVHYGSYLYPMSPMMKGLRGEIVEQRCDHWHLPLGGFYMMVATRDTPGIIPLRKSWHTVPQPLVGQTIARPSGFQQQSGSLKSD